MREQSALARKPRMYFFCKCVGVLYQGYRVLGIIGNFAPRRQDKKCAAANSKNVVPDAAPHILLKNFNSYSFSDWEGRLVNPRIMGKSNLHYCGFVRFEHEDEETEIFSKYFKFYGFKWQILGI